MGEKVSNDVCSESMHPICPPPPNLYILLEMVSTKFVKRIVKFEIFWHFFLVGVLFGPFNRIVNVEL